MKFSHEEVFCVSIFNFLPKNHPNQPNKQKKPKPHEPKNTHKSFW